MNPTALKVELLKDDPQLAGRLDPVFGRPEDPIEDVAQRAALLLGELQPIVWEGNAATFQFTYVSPTAETVLGYPCANWLTSGFWAGTVVHPEDQGHAVSYCALATGNGLDHDFQYRARTKDGRIVTLHDVVHVIKGSRGVAVRLRGIMVPVGQG